MGSIHKYASLVKFLLAFINLLGDCTCVLAEEAYLSNVVVWEDVLVTMGNSYSVKMWDVELNCVHEYKLPFRTWCAATVSAQYVESERKH